MLICFARVDYSHKASTKWKKNLTCTEWWCEAESSRYWKDLQSAIFWKINKANYSGGESSERKSYRESAKSIKNHNSLTTIQVNIRALRVRRKICSDSGSNKTHLRTNGSPSQQVYKRKKSWAQFRLEQDRSNTKAMKFLWFPLMRVRKVLQYNDQSTSFLLWAWLRNVYNFN